MHGITQPLTSRYGADIDVCKEMGWNLADLYAAPADMVEEIIERMNADSKWRHEAAKRAKAKR